MSDPDPLFLGDPVWAIPFQALVDGAGWDATGATVLAALADSATGELLVGPVTCDPGASGADPASALFIASFTAGQITAAGVEPGTVLLEVNVNGQTWQRRTLRVLQRAIP